MTELEKARDVISDLCNTVMGRTFCKKAQGEDYYDEYNTYSALQLTLEYMDEKIKKEITK